MVYSRTLWEDLSDPTLGETVLANKLGRPCPLSHDYVRDHTVLSPNNSLGMQMFLLVKMIWSYSK